MSPFRHRTQTTDQPVMEVPALLLKEATRQFAERGYDGVTVRDIAGAAGVNLALIGYYYGGKEGLYRACLENVGHMQLDRMPVRLEEFQGPEEFRVRLLELVLRMFSYYLEHPYAVRLMIREFLDHAHEGQGERPKGYIMPFQTLMQFFRDAQERGVVRADIQPLKAASLIGGMITQIMMLDPYKEKVLGLTLKDSDHRHELAFHVVSLVCDGYLTLTM